MLTPDDERTLQVLEWTVSHGSGYPTRMHAKLAFISECDWCEQLLKYNESCDRYQLTDAGRAKLAELREKGRGNEPG